MSRSTRRRYREQRLMMLAAALLVLFLALGDRLTPYGAATLDWNRPAPAAPAFQHAHWLGTDALGRDAYARLVDGARTSLAIAVGGALLALIVGATLGTLAGVTGGAAGTFILRVLESSAAVPQVFIIILVGLALGRGVGAVWVGIGLTGWLPVARILRAEAAHIATQPYIEAARQGGLGPLTVLLGHVVPNLGAALLAAFTVMVPQFLLAEGFVSFLGLGVQDPRASLGLLLAEAAASLERAPWLLIGPALVLSMVIAVLNAAADALQRRHLGGT
jgi:oligopeptide transport system permease protein